MARSLGLASNKEWWVWCKEGRPPNVPATPHTIYKDRGGQGWGHWLGTGKAVCGAKKFLPSAEALAVARSLRLASPFEWQQWCREGMCPPNVPSYPERTYVGGGWQRWGPWLGSGTLKKPSKFAPFGQVLAFAQSLGLANRTEWKAWYKEGMRPLNL